MLEILLDTFAATIKHIALVTLAGGEITGTRQGCRLVVSGDSVVNPDRLTFPVPLGAEVAAVAFFDAGGVVRQLQPVPLVRFQRAGRYVIEPGDVRFEFEEVQG